MLSLRAGFSGSRFSLPSRFEGRLRTDAAKRYKRVDRATAVIWKMLMIAEKRFRCLKAPGLMKEVYLGAQYVDGISTGIALEEVAA